MGYAPDLRECGLLGACGNSGHGSGLPIVDTQSDQQERTSVTEKPTATLTVLCWFCCEVQTLPDPGGDPESFLWRKRAARVCGCRPRDEILAERVLHSPPAIPFDRLDGPDEVRAWLRELWLSDRARVVHVEISRVFALDDRDYLPTPQQLTYWMELRNDKACRLVAGLARRTGITEDELLDLHRHSHERIHG